MNQVIGLVVAVAILVVGINIALDFIGWKRTKKRFNRVLTRSAESAVTGLVRLTYQFCRWAVSGIYNAVRHGF